MPEQPTCFVIMPISTPAVYSERYETREDHFTQILDALIAPAVEAAGFVLRPPSRAGSENIHAAIINDLADADLVLADLSTLNANVFLELGIRTALDRPVCLIWDGFDRLPFDMGTINTHKYAARPVYELNREITTLTQHIVDTVDQSSDGRNPLWRYFGTAVTSGLREAELNPSDATLEAKVDRLAALVERAVSAPVVTASRRPVSRAHARELDQIMHAIWSSFAKRTAADAELDEILVEETSTGAPLYRVIINPRVDATYEDFVPYIPDVEAEVERATGKNVSIESRLF